MFLVVVVVVAAAAAAAMVMQCAGLVGGLRPGVFVVSVSKPIPSALLQTLEVSSWHALPACLRPPSAGARSRRHCPLNFPSLR